MSVVEDFRNVLQDFLAPELRSMHAGIEAVDAKLGSLEKVMEARFKATNDVMESRFREVHTNFDKVFILIDGLKSALDLERRMERLETQKPN
jgi:predicted YcjX-like family ATPase